MSIGIKIANPVSCPICGKECGKSNLSYNGIEVWFACDCWPVTKIALLNTNNIRTKHFRWLGGTLNPRTGEIDWEDIPTTKEGEDDE